MSQKVKSLPAVQETQVRSLGQEDALEKGMGLHSGEAWRWDGPSELLCHLEAWGLVIVSLASTRHWMWAVSRQKCVILGQATPFI